MQVTEQLIAAVSTGTETASHRSVDKAGDSPDFDETYTGPPETGEDAPIDIEGGDNKLLSLEGSRNAANSSVPQHFGPIQPQAPVLVFGPDTASEPKSANSSDLPDEEADNSSQLMREGKQPGSAYRSVGSVVPEQGSENAWSPPPLASVLGNVRDSSDVPRGKIALLEGGKFSAATVDLNTPGTQLIPSLETPEISEASRSRASGAAHPDATLAANSDRIEIKLTGLAILPQDPVRTDVRPLPGNRTNSDGAPPTPVHPDAGDFLNRVTRDGNSNQRDAQAMPATQNPVAARAIASGTPNETSNGSSVRQPAESEPPNITLPVPKAETLPASAAPQYNSTMALSLAENRLWDNQEAINLSSLEILQIELRGGIRNGSAQVPTGSAVAQSVSNQISATFSEAVDGKIEVHLRPAELGRLTIHLNPTDTGLTATISTERPEVSELLRRHAEIFRRDLIDLGFSNVSLDFEAYKDGGQTERQKFTPVNGDLASDFAAEQVNFPVASPIRIALGGLDVRM